jgi:hypothetical protein
VRAVAHRRGHVHCAAEDTGHRVLEVRGAGIAAVATTLGCLAACGSTPPAATLTPSRSPSPSPEPTTAVSSSPSPLPTPSPPTPAAAASTSGPVGQYLTLDPASVPPGGTVRISGYAPHCTGVTILSNAFPGPQEFAGVHAVTPSTTPDGHFSATVTIPATTRPESYPVTVRACGGNLGVELPLKVT